MDGSPSVLLTLGCSACAAPFSRSYTVLLPTSESCVRIFLMSFAGSSRFEVSRPKGARSSGVPEEQVSLLESLPCP